MYNAVGIDVSKGKSTVAVLQPAGVIIRKPFNVNHTSSELDELAKYIGSLEGETRVVLECTGRYHEPVVKTQCCQSTSDQELWQQLHPQSQIRPC